MVNGTLVQDMRHFLLDIGLSQRTIGRSRGGIPALVGPVRREATLT